MRWNAGAGASAAGGGIRGGHVRISAVIDIEKSALRAFEENFFPSLQSPMQIDHRVGDKRPQLFPGGEIRFFTFSNESAARRELAG